MSARRPRTGGFAASLSASRYKSVNDKFKQRPSSAGPRSFRGSRSNNANGNAGSNMDRFHAHLRASLKVSKLRASGDNSLLERKQQDNQNEGSASTTSKKYNRVFRISRQDAAAERKKEGQDSNRIHNIRTSPARQKKSSSDGRGGNMGGRNDSHSPATSRKLVTAVNIKRSSPGSSSSRNRSSLRRDQFHRSARNGASLARRKFRPNTVENGYHHPESSAARIAKQIDEDTFNNEDMSDISKAAGGSFAHPPMTALPGRQLADFKFLSELGRGAHGVVHKVRSKIDNGLYVIKEIRLANLKPKRRKNVAQEVLLLRKLQHPNIIQYYTSFVENHALHIVMEYADGGDMYCELRKRRHDNRPMSEKSVWHYFSQCCLALRYLHNENIIHRDIKSMNVFLTKSKEVKLGDLGVSRLIDDDRNAQMSRVGTPMYFAPELVKREKYDFKVDAWALGCLVYSMMQLRAPFEGGNIYTLAVDIVKKSPKELPKSYSRQLRDVVFKMLEKDPKRRPSVDEIIQMFPYNLRMKVKNNASNNPSSSTGSSQNYDTNTSSTLSQTRSSSRNSFYNQSSSSQKGGGKIDFKQDMDNILAWKTVEDNGLETVEEGKNMSTSIQSNKMDDSTVGSTYIRQDNSSSVPSTRLIESLEESNSSDLETSKDRFGGSGPVGKANAYEGKVQTVQRNRVVADRDSHSTSNLETRDRFSSTRSKRKSSRQQPGPPAVRGNHVIVGDGRSRGDLIVNAAREKYDENNVIVDVHSGEMKQSRSRHIINPDKFFDGTQKYLRKQNRPFSAGRVRDRRKVRSNVEQHTETRRRRRPRSAGPSRRRDYANTGIGNGNNGDNQKGNGYSFSLQRRQQLQRRRPQSAGVGNRRRHWNAPGVDVPSSTRLIVVKQYGVS